MAKSTTGKWTITYDPDTGRPLEIVSADDHDHRIAFLASDGTAANADLLAASPDLLAVCKEIDRLLFVIESAVRNSAPSNYGAVAKALKANIEAISSAEGRT